MEENNAVLNPETQHKRTLSRGMTIKRGAKGGCSIEKLEFVGHIFESHFGGNFWAGIKEIQAFIHESFRDHFWPF